MLSGTERLAWLGALLLTSAYCAVFAGFSSALPFQDYPNHLARAVVMADLMFHHGHVFAGYFQYRFLAVPYVLGDLLLAAAIALFGVTAAAALWTMLVIASLPLSLVFYMRVLRASPAASALACVLALYLSTDWFFVKGFLEFRLAVAMILAGMGLAQLVRQRLSIALFAAYVTVLVLGYLVHLTVPLFEMAAIGMSGLLSVAVGRSRVRRELAILAPLVVIFAWQFGVTPRYRLATDDPSAYYEWGTISDKVAGLDWHFMRYNLRLDSLMLLVLAACIVWPLRRVREAVASQPAARETLVLSLVFLVLYVAMPRAYADAWWVDVRAAEMATLMLVVAMLLLGNHDAHLSKMRSFIPLSLAALLAVGNLVYLTRHMLTDKHWVDAYRQAVAALPEGARVLPVHTRAKNGSTYPFLHVGSFVVIDRHGITPYIFSGDGGFPMKYFRYRDRPEAPDDEWYKAKSAVDWRRIECNYDYLLVTKPFDATRIALSTTVVADNASATLLALPKDACPLPTG